jgi:hypothetical protein
MKWVKEKKKWKNDDNDVFVSTLLQKYVPILLCNLLNNPSTFWVKMMKFIIL